MKILALVLSQGYIFNVEWIEFTDIFVSLPNLLGQRLVNHLG